MSPTERFGPIEEQIRVQAADWFARMRGPEADASRPAFDAWYAIPAHARAYEQIVGRWEQSAFIGASRTGRDRQLKRAGFGARNPGFSAAAALVCVIAGSALLYAGYRGHQPAGAAPAWTAVRYASGTAVQEIALSDGSRLTLDKASLVLVSYTSGRRIVELAHGRARFAPTHDPGRPFWVRVGSSEVTGDNSIFDAAYRGEATVVSALAGQVSVQSRAASAPARLVLASQRLIIPKNGPVPAATAAPAWASDWLPRMIALDHTSLADAALQVGRGAPVQLLFSDDASALSITGTFKSGDVESLARAAQALFHLHRARDAAGNIVLSRRPQTARQ